MISIYYEEPLRGSRSKPYETVKWLERSVTVTAKSLDDLQSQVKAYAERTTAATTRSVLVQSFLWTDDKKGSVHIAYEIQKASVGP